MYVITKRNCNCFFGGSVIESTTLPVTLSLDKCQLPIVIGNVIVSISFRLQITKLPLSAQLYARSSFDWRCRSSSKWPRTRHFGSSLVVCVACCAAVCPRLGRLPVAGPSRWSRDLLDPFGNHCAAFRLAVSQRKRRKSWLKRMWNGMRTSSFRRRNRGILGPS